jgi:hypothetical protein
MPRICAVHLVWGPLGLDHLQRFLASYVGHDPGCPHELVVVMNNCNRAVHADAQAHLRGIAHQVFVPEQPVFDLEAYRLVTRAFAADVYCFLNSYSRVLSSGWLAQFVAALASPRVGVAAAGASYRSMREYNPWSAPDLGLPFLKRTALQVSMGQRAFETRLAFAASPSPHVRSNGFALAHETVAMLGWPQCDSKWATWKWESGRRGLTTQVRRLGLRSVVVDREGRVFDIAEWPTSNTYWSGNQSGLLVADNRSDEYERATPEARARLSAENWVGQDRVRELP